MRLFIGAELGELAKEFGNVEEHGSTERLVLDVGFTSSKLPARK
jgi:hypothetical protein